MRTAGRDDFYAELVRLLGGLASHQGEIVVRYVPGQPPEDVILLHYPRYKADFYKRGFIKYDPFFRYWSSGVTEPVVTTRDVLRGPRWKSPYARQFMRVAGISDDLGLYLPPTAGNTIALFLERASGAFTAAEVRRIRAAVPLFVALQRVHVTRVFERMARGDMGGASAWLRGPVRIVDRRGQVLFATPSWKQAEVELTGLRKALRSLKGSAKGDVIAFGNTTLRQGLLDNDFLFVDGCTIYTLEPTPKNALAGPSDMLRRLSEDLTRRELEIVDLVLKGHPSAKIAGKLGISRATVKNHKRSIYAKLDITTERELFVIASEPPRRAPPLP